MAEAEEKEEKHDKAHPVIGLTIWMFLFFTFYVLSVGPVVWLYEIGVLNSKWGDAILIVYAPLIWVKQKNVLPSEMVTIVIPDLMMLDMRDWESK